MSEEKKGNGRLEETKEKDAKIQSEGLDDQLIDSNEEKKHTKRFSNELFVKTKTSYDDDSEQPQDLSLGGEEGEEEKNPGLNTQDQQLSNLLSTDLLNHLNLESDDSNKDVNSDEELMLIEKLTENNNNFTNYQFQEDKLNLSDINSNEPYNKIKKQLELNKNDIPRILSYGMNLNGLDGLGSNPQNSMSMNNLASMGNPINFPSDSFTMNGKSGWVCQSCTNFNYEARTVCNRCGKPQGVGAHKVGSTVNMSPPFDKRVSDKIGGIHSNSQMNLTGALYANSNLIMSPIGGLKYQYSPKGNDEKFDFGLNSKKKKKPFVEREGDWVCSKCKNLNFAFRTNCNRCHVPKDHVKKE